MPILITILILLLPQIAWANSMAPVFPLISGIGWLAMPLIITVEACYYMVKKINNPIKLAIYSNIASAVVGLGLAILTFPLMLGPAVEPPIWIIFLGTVVTIIAIVFHWWLSSNVEFKFSKWHKNWGNSDISISVFYKANGITYSLISIWFVVSLIRMLIENYAKT